MTQNNTAKILIVDDEPVIRDLLSRILTREGYCCSTSTNGESAIELLEGSEFHLVVSDIMMPGISGLDLLKVIRNRFLDVAVLLVTGINDRTTGIEALELGAYGYLIKPFQLNDALIGVANALERRRLTLISRKHEEILEKRVQERTREVREREEEMLLRLTSAMGYRDDETGSHARRLGLYASVLARDLGWDPEAVNNIRLAAPMHDVGKIGIPDNILLKPGTLSRGEFRVMKEHCRIGAQILHGTDVPLLHMAEDIALSHHEAWDGAGYPHGLTGEAIPKAARIVAIVDVYDALVHDRVYRPAYSEDQAVSIMISENTKGRYDPEIFEHFLTLLPQIRAIRHEYRDTPRHEETGSWLMQEVGLAS